MPGHTVSDPHRYQWGVGPNAVIDLKHDFIETDDIKELINIAAAKLLTEDHKQRVGDCASPLNLSTTISWGPDVLDTIRENEKAIDKENCLIHMRFCTLVALISIC